MPSPRRAAWLAAAGLLLAGPASAQALRRTTLTVSDHLSAGQQEETIQVYFGGVLSGTLHVDAAHPDDSFITTVPLQDTLGFTLCGKLLRREGGAVATHPIDNGGTLIGYDQVALAAITLGDVLFTLQDDGGRAESTVRQGPACSAAIS